MPAVDLALLILRLTIAAVFLAHGFNHIFGGGKIAGTGRWFESLGMRPGWVHAWTASLTEVGSGALLAAGLLTPLAGAGVVGVMLVAWITNHRGNGFFIFRPGEGWEYVMTLTSLGVVVGVLGPGRWSLDDVLGLLHWDGWRGLVVSLGVGGVGAALLLAAAWRPTRPGASLP
ncbi:MAG TPA: DoxX family protein [Acidimicrobiales bacterium]|nr:DoxX family protein [Acidimicrobiales bacterium]